MLVKMSLTDLLLETDANEAKGPKHDDLGAWRMAGTGF